MKFWHFKDWAEVAAGSYYNVHDRFLISPLAMSQDETEGDKTTRLSAQKEYSTAQLLPQPRCDYFLQGVKNE